jgi:hypothetical protein
VPGRGRTGHGGQHSLDMARVQPLDGDRADHRLDVQPDVGS